MVCLFRYYTLPRPQVGMILKERCSNQVSYMLYFVYLKITCKIWFEGVIHNRNDKAGSIHFELMVD